MEDKLAMEFKKLRLRFIIGGIVLLVTFLILSVLWNKSIKRELADQAAKVVKQGVLLNDKRGVFSALNGIQIDSFESVTYYGPDNERVLTLPPSTAHDGYRKMHLWDRVKYGEVQKAIFWDGREQASLGVLSFVYPRFGLAPHALAVWALAIVLLYILLKQAQARLQEELVNEIELRQSLLSVEIAKKIRHDIRSPLAVLEALLERRPKNEAWFLEQSQSALKRLKEIVSEIDSAKVTIQKGQPTERTLTDVRRLCLQIASEKNLVHRETSVEINVIQDEPLYTSIDGGKLKSSLSNIVNNALQATSNSRAVTIEVSGNQYAISIVVRDVGKGIPSEVISRVFDKGFTYGKEFGSGLGLFYAKELMDENSGNIEIVSQAGDGTSVTLLFPREKTPSWHLETLSFSKYSTVLVFDDQESIRNLWRLRLEEMQYRGRFEAHSSFPSDFASSAVSKEETLILMDYDLGAGENGLDALARVHAPHRSILVTGHYDDPRVQKRCAEIGCRLLAKDQIAVLAVI